MTKSHPIPTTHQSAILYESPDQNYIVLDLPLSLSLAQLPRPQSSLLKRRIFSSPPLEQPYQSTEPKSDTARANILARSTPEDQARDAEYRDFIEEGLSRIHQSYRGPFSLSRLSDEALNHTSNTRRGKKRKRQAEAVADLSEAAGNKVELKSEEPQLAATTTATTAATTASFPNPSSFLEPLTIPQHRPYISALAFHSLANRPVSNSSATNAAAIT
ncbi:MAG: hypothetical protein LQ340_004708, partial [Diploschistes diacapsis]